MTEIKVGRINSQAKLPTRKHPHDAGMDLYSVEDAEVKARTFKLVHTGIIIEIPEGFVGIIKPKGGNNHLIGAGVIDAGYTGELILKIFNPTDIDMVFEKGHPMGQIVIYPTITPVIKEVFFEEITDKKTDRGATGGIHQVELPYGKGWD